MATITPIPGNADPVVVLSATGAGAGAITFLHNTGGEGGKPAQLFPASFIFAITDIVGTFSALQINLEWSPITSTDPPQFETIGTWNALASPTVFFPCSSTGQYRLNCTSFTGGTSFNIYASIASSMPQGSGGGGGGGSVTQGTVPWIDNIAQVAGVALGATGVVAYGSTPAAVNVPGVNAFITNAGSIGGGTQFADNAASGATPTGVLSMGWDSANSKIRALKVDATQNLLVDISNASIAVTGTVAVSNPETQYASGSFTLGPTGTQVLGWDGTDVWGISATHFASTSVNALATQIIDAGGSQIGGQIWGSVPIGNALNVNAAIFAHVAGSSSAELTVNSLDLIVPTKYALDSNFLTVKGQLISTAANGIIKVGVVGNVGATFDYVDNTASGANPSGLLAAGWDSSALRVRALKVDANQNLDVNVNAALPAGTNVIGHIISDSGSVAKIQVNDGNVLTSNSTNTGGFPAAEALDVNILSIRGTAPTTPGFLDIKGTVTANQGAANTPANRWPVQVTDGINLMPTGDVIARAIFHQITDGTNGPAAVKPPSTAAIATDAALVVALSPNNPVAVSFPAVQTVQGLAGGIPEPTTESSPMKDILVQMLLALDAVNMNLGRLMAGDPMSRQELAGSEF